MGWGLKRVSCGVWGADEDGEEEDNRPKTTPVTGSADDKELHTVEVIKKWV